MSLDATSAGLGISFPSVVPSLVAKNHTDKKQAIAKAPTANLIALNFFFFMAHSLLLDEDTLDSLNDPAQNRSSDADGDHAHQNNVRAVNSPRLVNHEPKALGGRQQLRRNQGIPGSTQRYLQARKDHWQRGGDGNFKKELEIAGPKGLSHPEMNGFCMFDAGVRVDDASNKC